MEDIEKYIVYIEPHDPDAIVLFGAGVLVGNYLITAGHLVNTSTSLSFYFEGHRIQLSNEDLVFFEDKIVNTYREEANDIAIFKVNNINSPLVLSSETPSDENELKSISFHHVITTNEDSDNLPVYFRTNETIEQLKCNIVVEENINDDILVCHSSVFLHRGCSGSPLLLESKVMGILVAGMPETDIVVFQSSVSIIKHLNSMSSMEPVLSDLLQSSKM